MPPSPLAEETLPLLPGEVLAEKYKVERVLGRGGMGFVVAARNIDLGKRVAIKMMLPAALNIPQAVARFEREARAAAQLKSDHVAEVLDIGKLPTGEPYIVMELLSGSDFEDLLQRERWLTVEDAVDYLLQICEAVSEAHALGVVHRDLKPKNLFLSHRLDGTPVVKVLDFGISKWTVDDSDSHSLTSTSDVFGSPNYMSPEQIRSARAVDGRTDIWSLGVILFELLTGRVPFLAESMPQLCALVLETPAPLVSTLRGDVPEGLVAIVARCLEKAVERRFQNVGELVAALAPFGPVRPLRGSGSGRISGANVSPSASTLGAGSGALRGLPAAGSGAVRSGMSNNTSASWVQPAVPRRPGGRWLIGLTAIPVAVVVGGLWLGLRWQTARLHLADHDAGPPSTAPLPTTTTTATATVATTNATATAEPTALVSAATSVTPPASSSGSVSVRAAPPKLPLPPSRTNGASDAGPVHTTATATAATTTPPGPPDDPLSPGARK